MFLGFVRFTYDAKGHPLCRVISRVRQTNVQISRNKRRKIIISGITVIKRLKIQDVYKDDFIRRIKRKDSGTTFFFSLPFFLLTCN